MNFEETNEFSFLVFLQYPNIFRLIRGKTKLQIIKQTFFSNKTSCSTVVKIFQKTL